MRISAASLRPNAEKVSALIDMPMPNDVEQVRALMGGINYYPNFSPDLSKRLRPINARLRKGVKSAFRPAGKIGARISGGACESAAFCVLQLGRCRRWVRSVQRVLRRLHRRGLRRLEQEQEDGFIKPLAYVSRASPDSDRHWSPLDLESGSIDSSLKLLRVYLVALSSAYSPTTRPWNA